MRRLIVALSVLVLALPARAQDLTVFAAASLTDALQDIGKVWEAGGHSKIRFNFAASSTLARQMDQGAQANLFASADLQWMDWATAHGLIGSSISVSSASMRGRCDSCGLRGW